MRNRVYKQLEERRMRRRWFSEKYNRGWELEHFNMSETYFLAVAMCKEWSKHRRWLIANGLDLAKFEEETQF